jgi:glyoxylase-like metal-dependent hydrolase (beta-lactamase superfamily II)
MFQANCYVITCPKTKEGIIIDPGFNNEIEAEKILKFIEKNEIELRYIVNTHGHPDHTCGNGFVKRKFDTPIMIHKNDAHLLGASAQAIAEALGFKTHSPEADILLEDGNSVKFGQVSLKVMHTPGHSRGSTSLVGENEVFTGDTLFAGSIGRTDFPESSNLQMQQSLQKLKALPNRLAVYPGHGPATTIGEEKRSNPFMQAT